jgi:RNA polymerase sigma-70 factor (sigma-E family)
VFGIDFEEFVSARGGALVQTAYLLTGDQAAAEDLVQIALMRTYAKWEQVDHPLSYTRRAVLNAFLDGRRRPRREIPSRSYAAAVADEHADGQSVATRIATREALWQVVLALPPRERAVVVLRYYEDLDDHEIATALRIRHSTVRATVSRALARLRRAHLSELQGER